MAIRRVWIEEGCISCNLCEDLVSEVFQVPAGETSRTRKGHEKLLGDPGIAERVQEAADSCPVEVIKVDKA
jgi:ferredoxin